MPFLRELTSFNNKRFTVLCREHTNDYDLYTSVMMEDAYRLQCFPLREGMVAIDLGAHIGTVSLMLASMGVKVYAVEPIPENVEIFNYNVSRNGYSHLIKIYANAVASTNGVVKVYYQKEPVHFFIGKVGEVSNKFVEAEAVTLEQIFRENVIKRCHLMKVDVEGAEWDALKSIPEDVLQRIDVVIGEVHRVDQVSPSTVDHSSLLPFFKGYFEDASMVYQQIDSSPGKAQCDAIGGVSNFIYVRKGLTIPYNGE